MRCQDVMRHDNPMISIDSTAEYAATLMRDENVGFLAVVEDEEGRRLLGVVTDRDLAITIVANNLTPREVRLEDVMTPAAVTAHPDDSIEAVERKLADAELHRLPVVDEHGRVLGIVSIHDLAQVEDTARTGRIVRAAAKPWAHVE